MKINNPPTSVYISQPDPHLMDSLSGDCFNCTGLCCVALYFSKSDGFPSNKASGTPCSNLSADFRCCVHPQLKTLGFRGCMSFDCLGAGQKAAALYPSANWTSAPPKAPEMYEVFLRLWRLHQFLWYLSCASSLTAAEPFLPDLNRLLCENRRHASLPPDQLLSLDLMACQQPVNALLKPIIAAVSKQVSGKTTQNVPSDCMGKNFRSADLTGANFTMLLPIAANLSGCRLRGVSFLGADLRDANLRGADLSESIFLTQAQLNSAQGDSSTKLPPFLIHPATWE